MFFDDEKARNDRRRDRRAVLYITATALAACVLMIVGLLNTAHAQPFDHGRMILEGEIGATPIVLDLDHGGRALDPTVTHATKTASAGDASVDRRLAAGIALASLVTVAGVSQLLAGSDERSDAPAPWRSEA